jgi:hypothetical protein
LINGAPRFVQIAARDLAARFPALREIVAPGQPPIPIVAVPRLD